MEYSRRVLAQKQLFARQLEAVAEARHQVLREQWTEALAASYECMGLGMAMVEQATHRGRAREASRSTQVADLDTHVEASLPPAARLARIEKAIVQLRQELPPDVVEGLQAVLDRSPSPVPTLGHLWNARKPVILDDPLLHAGIEASVQGLLSLAHGSFNTSWHEAGSPMAVEGIIASAQAARDRYRTYLAELLLRLKAEDLWSLRPEARALASWIRRRVPRLASEAATLHKSYETVLEAGQGQRAEIQGRALAKLTLLIRELIAGLAAAERLAACSSQVLPPELAELENGRDQLSLPHDFPGGRDVALADLVVDSGDVEVEGVAQTVSTTRNEDGRLRSHVSLRDPSSGATARLNLDFVHLPHLGIQSGAFVRASGRTRRDSRGELEVKVERLALAELAKQSFHVAFLRLARPWFRPRPNGLNLLWTWQPQRSADERFGASELRYGKTLRLSVRGRR